MPNTVVLRAVPRSLAAGAAPPRLTRNPRSTRPWQHPPKAVGNKIYASASPSAPMPSGNSKGASTARTWPTGYGPKPSSASTRRPPLRAGARPPPAARGNLDNGRRYFHQVIITPVVLARHSTHHGRDSGDSLNVLQRRQALRFLSVSRSRRCVALSASDGRLRAAAALVFVPPTSSRAVVMR